MILFFSVLSQLENSPETYGISTFSVGMTTLEEVFLRIGGPNDESLPNVSS